MAHWRSAICICRKENVIGASLKVIFFPLFSTDGCDPWLKTAIQSEPWVLWFNCGLTADLAVTISVVCSLEHYWVHLTNLTYRVCIFIVCIIRVITKWLAGFTKCKVTRHHILLLLELHLVEYSSVTANFLLYFSAHLKCWCKCVAVNLPV